MKEKMLTKINNFFNKDNFRLAKMTILFFLSIIFAIVIEGLIFSKKSGFFSIDRIIIVFGSLLFLSLHIIFKLKNMYEWIYNKRYVLAILFLAFAVIMGYSGSSITNYDSCIQAESSDNSYKPLFGEARGIRSDEWAVNTPLIFSQDKTGNTKYPYFNMNIRGAKTDMFTIINAPVKDLVTVGKPFNIGYLFFGNSRGLSFWWYGRLIALMLISFELCMIITDKNKLISLFAMLLITFSPATQWWYSNFILDILIFGQLALIFIDKFMTENKKYKKILSLIGVGFCAVSYVFIFYPAWIISFGYVYLAIFIWIVYKNLKVYKVNLKDILAVLLVVLVVALIGVRFYLISKDTLDLTLHTDYPGARFETGGGSIRTMFSYVYAMLMPYKDIVNPCEYSNMLSLYPLPMIISILFLFKNRMKSDFKKHCMYLVPLLVVSILLSIWVAIPTNKLFAKLTLLYMIPMNRAAVSLGFAQIMLMLYLLKNITKDTKLFSSEISFIISGAIATVALIIAVQTGPQNYFGSVIGFVFGTAIFILFYMMFNLHREKYKYYFMAIMTGVVLISGATVNPVIKGTNVMSDKPVAKEIQSIVSEDKEALWLVDNMSFFIPNYVIANGARVINSTNYYPNFELYEKLFGEDSKKEEIRKIYNRYAHISINVDNVETNLKLMYPDAFTININPEKLDDINVKYILSSKDLSMYNTNSVTFEEIYNEYGCYIFEVKY